MVSSMCYNRKNKCFDLDRITNEEDFFIRVITGDELWIFNTILRSRGKVRRGTLWALFDRRKLEWANRRSNQCWFFFYWSQIVLFSKLKTVLKGRLFGTLKNIKKIETDMLKTIPVEDPALLAKGGTHLDRCVAAHGNYFERNDIHVWKKKNIGK